MWSVVKVKSDGMKAGEFRMEWNLKKEIEE